MRFFLARLPMQTIQLSYAWYVLAYGNLDVFDAVDTEAMAAAHRDEIVAIAVAAAATFALPFGHVAVIFNNKIITGASGRACSENAGSCLEYACVARIRRSAGDGAWSPATGCDRP